MGGGRRCGARGASTGRRARRPGYAWASAGASTGGRAVGLAAARADSLRASAGTGRGRGASTGRGAELARGRAAGESTGRGRGAWSGTQGRSPEASKRKTGEERQEISGLQKEGGDCEISVSVFACAREGGGLVRRYRGRRKNQTFFAPKDVHALVFLVVGDFNINP